MAIQICPKCKKESFSWLVGGNQTIWFCLSCNYSVIEDESLERICSTCNLKTEIQLKRFRNRVLVV